MAAASGLSRRLVPADEFVACSVEEGTCLGFLLLLLLLGVPLGPERAAAMDSGAVNNRVVLRLSKATLAVQVVLRRRLVLVWLLLLTNEVVVTAAGGAVINRRGTDATRGSPLLLAIKKVMMVLPLPPRMKQEKRTNPGRGATGGNLQPTTHEGARLIVLW